MPKGRRRIRTAVRNTVRAVVSEDPSLMMATAFGLACCLVFWGAGSSLETVAMRSSELASLGAQADALSTFVSTGGTLAALVLVGCIPKRFAGRLCGSGLYAIACAALAVVYALTLAPLSVSVFAVRMGLLVARGFLGASTLFLWFVLIGRCKRSFHVVVLALAFACAALLDLAFLALQPIVGIAALVSLPALSVAMHRIVARRLGLCAHPVEDESVSEAVPKAKPPFAVAFASASRLARLAASPFAFCLLSGAVMGCIQAVGADPVLDHDRLAEGYVANNVLVACALGVAGALVVAGAAFARGEGDEPLLSYQRLVVIIALVLSLCLVNVTLQAGTFVSLTAAKFIGALLLSYSWLAALSTRKAGAVRSFAWMLVSWQTAAVVLQGTVMALAGLGPVQVVNVAVVVLLGVLLIVQLFPLLLSTRGACAENAAEGALSATEHPIGLSDEVQDGFCATAAADRERFERFCSEYSLTPREQELLAIFAEGYSVAYASELLVLSPYTVRTHQRNIYLKTDTHSRDELLALLKAF